jgi:protein-serine/threonine kinase
MGVSNPTNFTHKVHVGFDPLSGGFTGLPGEWAKLLNASAITKEDYAKNPQAVIEVLEFYSKETARAEEYNNSNSTTANIPTNNNTTTNNTVPPLLHG